MSKAGLVVSKWDLVVVSKADLVVVSKLDPVVVSKLEARPGGSKPDAGPGSS